MLIQFPLMAGFLLQRPTFAGRPEAHPDHQESCNQRAECPHPSSRISLSSYLSPAISNADKAVVLGPVFEAAAFAVFAAGWRRKDCQSITYV